MHHRSIRYVNNMCTLCALTVHIYYCWVCLLIILFMNTSIMQKPKLTTTRSLKACHDMPITHTKRTCTQYANSWTTITCARLRKYIHRSSRSTNSTRTGNISVHTLSTLCTHYVHNMCTFCCCCSHIPKYMFVYTVMTTRPADALCGVSERKIRIPHMRTTTSCVRPFWRTAKTSSNI